MTRSFVNTTPQHVMRALAAAGLFALASAAHAAPPVPGLPSFAAIGDVSNAANQGGWEHHGVDGTTWVTGASNAQLGFDFANDLEGTGSTATHAPTRSVPSATTSVIRRSVAPEMVTPRATPSSATAA